WLTDGRDTRCAPPPPPRVFRRRAFEQHTRVVCGAAADHPRARLRAVLLVVALPEVGLGREQAGVEDVGRPAAFGRVAVVRARLDEADRAVGVLAQPRSERAACGAAPEDEDVVPHAGASARTRARDARLPLCSNTFAACCSTAAASAGRPARASTAARSASAS